MLYRSLAAGLAFLAALVMTIEGAGAFDETKYPKFEGQWKRKLGTVNALPLDRKSTRLNSSHVAISYAVFCLKKKSARLVTPIVALTAVLRTAARRANLNISRG